MSENEKIERLERTLGTLIAWLRRELGDSAMHDLLDMLKEGGN